MTSSDDDAAGKTLSEALIPRFRYGKLLNQDQAGRRVSLYGSIDDEPAILLAERAAFSTEPEILSSFVKSLDAVKNLGANDIYNWYLAYTAPSSTSQQPHDLKLNLIYPCTNKHVAKYTAQGVRLVTETPEIYEGRVRPLLEQRRSENPKQLDWVYNIIEGRTEQEDVIFRAHSGEGRSEDEGFLLLPDLNWDRQTLTSLHLLGVVERRDIWSLRDLSKKHIPWLKDMKTKLLAATTKLYKGVDKDQLKLYVHYQPTYYHFHIHVVHVMLEAGGTQAVGKAWGLDSIISQLETMSGGEDAGMREITISYTLGEASDLWQEIFKHQNLLDV